MSKLDLFDRLLPFAPAVFFLAALALAWFGEHGFDDHRALRDALRQNERLTVEVRGKNAVLEEQVRRLQQDPETIERVAREELDMGYPGDRVFRFVRQTE